MSVTLAVALLALLVSLFTLVALVAVYARVRGLEAGAAAGLSVYPTLVGRPAPAAVRPDRGQRAAVVAVLDGDCALCRTVLLELATQAPAADVRVVALTDAATDLRVPPGVERVADTAARADLYEGYAPTLLAVDAAGTVVARRFVYPDTDVAVLLRELTAGSEVSRA